MKKEKQEVTLRLCERCSHAHPSNGYYCAKLQLNVHNAMKFCKGKEFKNKEEK